MPQVFANNVRSTLAAAIGSTDASIPVATGTGALFPALSAGQYFVATIINASDQVEVVKITARAGDTLTAERGQDGTTQRAFSAGDKIEMRLTAGTLARLVQGEQIDPGTASRIKGVWYVSASDSLTDHSAASTSGTLAWTLAQIGGGRATVVLPGGRTYTLTADLTIAENISLVLQPNAILSPAAGKTLTLNCDVQAGPYQVFGGAGSVAGSLRGGTALAAWGGARGDGFTDDTAGLARVMKFPRLRFPAGTYIISSPLPLQRYAYVEGEELNNSYIDWDSDWQQETPTYAGKAAVIQYAQGQHGAMFDVSSKAGDDTTFRHMVFRCGQTRTTADRFFSAHASHACFEGCKFENLEKFICDDTAGNSYGALQISNCKFFGVSKCFYGPVVDCIVRGNTFTTCGTVFDLTSGSGFNTIAGNRFEWGDVAITIYRGRTNTVIGNTFDAHNFNAIRLHNSSSNHISGNVFWRNGRDGTSAEKRSHIVIKESASANFIHGNTFLAGCADGGSNSTWPKYIVETLSAVGGANIFRNNDTVSGCVEAPLYDAYDNSSDVLICDEIHIKGIGNPGGSNDALLDLLRRISTICSNPVDVHIYENRAFTIYTNLAAFKINLIGHGNVTLSNTSGTANKLGSLQALTYGQAYGNRNLPNTFAASPPPTGYWEQGSIVWNTNPGSGGYVGWVCTVPGDPGTWRGFGAIS